MPKVFQVDKMDTMAKMAKSNCFKVATVANFNQDEWRETARFLNYPRAREQPCAGARRFESYGKKQAPCKRLARGGMKAT